MSVSSVSGSNPYAAQSPYVQTNQDMQALQSALSSGNLSGAQTDFASFSNDIASFLQNGPSAQTQKPAADLQTLQSALNSGNLAAAQSDLATLQQDLKAAGKHYGHHRHGASSTQSGAPGTTSTTATATSGTGGTGTNSSSVASMLAAYTGGSTSGSAGLVNATA